MFKQISYIQTPQGWQTYVFPVSGGYRRYKLLTTIEEFEQAKENCNRLGWKVTNATAIVTKMNSHS